MEALNVPPAAATDVRVIAFFLPQFHPIPENDHWWGEGFTEWTNVRKARPNYEGHYQPHVPGELGYYDLRDPAVQERQAGLAAEHGIHGFCYYYYWFNGQRLLERPLDQMVTSGRPGLPFCVCWANENWTRRWDGLEREILIAQRYGLEDSRALIRSLLPLFGDPRYIRIRNRPLFIVYKPDAIPELKRTAEMWRDECARAGMAEPYLCAAVTSWYGDPAKFGFDALVEFPPHGTAARSLVSDVMVTNPKFSGMVLSYRNYVAQLLTAAKPPFPLFRTVMPAWDNTARRQNTGMILAGSSPEAFGYWLEETVAQTRVRHAPGERLVFINAWNEWAEGCHLEPDERYGRQYLQAVRSAVQAPPRAVPPRPAWAELRPSVSHAVDSERRSTSRHFEDAVEGRPAVSVIMPVYNHERFVAEAIESVFRQTRRDIELIVVDDGSADRSPAIVEEILGGTPRIPVSFIRQQNRGAHAAINRGLVEARGEFISIINSDDRYAPQRLAVIIDEMIDRDAGIAFSNTRFIDDEGAEIGADNRYVEGLRTAIRRAAADADPLIALLQINVAISTGNFVLRRAVVERVGGFSSMRVCHDWDFLLAASYVAPLAFVDQQLYEYRIHRSNTYSGLALQGSREMDQLLARFLGNIDRHALFRDPTRREHFLDRVRECGLINLLPDAIRAASGTGRS